MLGVENLENRHFLDIGCGSGLFSLAAKRLGAKVFSFDFDPNSVACAEYLKEKYFLNDPNWTIQRGSVLDENYLKGLGQFDVVYSWGVLHHTGQMWKALENVVIPTKKNGSLYIAIYNDQGLKSKIWWWVKRFYCSGLVGKWALLAIFLPYFFLRTFAKSLITGKNQWREYRLHRGMSIVYDWFDWLGGYPFEVASVEAITDFYSGKGFSRVKLLSTKGWGNNQFVFTKN